MTSRGVTVVAARDRRKRPARNNRAAPFLCAESVMSIARKALPTHAVRCLFVWRFCVSVSGVKSEGQHTRCTPTGTAEAGGWLRPLDP